MKRKFPGLLAALFATLALPAWAAGGSTADRPQAVDSAHPDHVVGDTNADNTSRNKTDRDAHAVTPLDQGNNSSDLEISARIRKEIMAADHLSVNAQNVKIVTVGGHVTLRGPVATGEEKRLIGEIAGRLVRNENVENKLEVKSAANVSRN